MSEIQEKINTLKVELFDILEQQSILQRRIAMFEELKQSKTSELNEARKQEQEEAKLNIV